MKKKCYKCKIEKSIDDFYKDRNGTYGVNSKCKLCSSDSFKEYYKNNKEKFDMHNKEYVVCEDCFNRYKRYNKTKHLKTLKHINLTKEIENLNLIS